MFLEQKTKLFETGQFADIVIHIDDGTKTFRAHRCILALASEYFKNLFEQGPKEEYFLNDVKPEIFEVILRYIYTEDLSKCETRIQDILVAADKYSINPLVERCEIELCKEVTLDNYKELLELSQRYGFPELRKAIIQFLKKTFKTLIGYKIWNELNYHDAENVLDSLEAILRI